MEWLEENEHLMKVSTQTLLTENKFSISCYIA